MSKDDVKLLPFERAKQNIIKTAENFNVYNSVQMLVEAIDGMSTLDEEERVVLEKMFATVIKEMSTYLQEREFEWN